MKTIPEVFAFVLEIEEKYQLFDLKYKEYYIWKIIRTRFADSLYEYVFPNSDSVLAFSFMLKSFFIILFSNIADYFKKLFVIKPCDTMIFGSARKLPLNGEKVDLYFNDIVLEQEKNNKRYILVDSIKTKKATYRPNAYVLSRNRFFLELTRFYLWKFYKLDLKSAGLDSVMEQVRKDVKESIGMDLNLERLIQKEFAFFLASKKYYDKLFDRFHPKQVYIMNSSSNVGLIAAAKERGIIVNEMQHAGIHKINLDIVFPDDAKVPYLADNYYVWGAFWIEVTKFHKDVNPVVYSNSFFKSKFNYDKSKKNGKSCVFISSLSFGKELADIALKMKSINPEFTMYYKLHDEEHNLWKTCYPELLKAHNAGQIEVITTQRTLHDILAECEYAIGVYSTAIYEALMEDCKIICVPLEGFEYIEELIKRGYVQFMPESYDFRDIEKLNFKLLDDKGHMYY